MTFQTLKSGKYAKPVSYTHLLAVFLLIVNLNIYIYSNITKICRTDYTKFYSFTGDSVNMVFAVGLYFSKVC